MGLGLGLSKGYTRARVRVRVSPRSRAAASAARFKSGARATLVLDRSGAARVRSRRTPWVDPEELVLH